MEECSTKIRTSKKQVGTEQDALKEEDAIRAYIGPGGKILCVRAKHVGRIVWHRIAVTSKGQIHFVDHGMCSPKALVADFDLGVYSAHEVMQRDMCTALALFIVRPKDDFLRRIPIEPERGPRGKMTDKLRNLYSEEAYEFVHRLRSVRDIRQAEHSRLQQCSEMKPFIHSAKARMDAVLHRIAERQKDKLDRVCDHLEQQGHTPRKYQWAYWRACAYSFEPDKLPP